MDNRTEANVSQLAADVHFIAAPFRYVWNLLVVFALLFPSPLLVVGVVTVSLFGGNVRGWLLRLPWFPPIWANLFSGPSPEETWLLKIVLAVFGPFAFIFWFMLVSHWLQCRRSGSQPPSYGKYILCFVLSLGGSLFASSHFRHSDNATFFLMVALGIMSPAILIAAGGLFRGAVER
jgi:hypothetical protein